jgi:outer membrane protein OmpA-like peptidoglycan-associated protein/uncharacterized protein YidB (DUF937 family)
MTMFDSLIGQVAGNFGLGDRAQPLLQQLLSLITNQQSGGLSGFLGNFQQAGLGNLVDSWVGKGENLPISTEQLQNALGSNTIEQIAAKAGIPAATAIPALATMIPSVVDKLTPSGALSNILPAGLSQYLPGIGGAVGEAGTGAGAPKNLAYWLLGLLGLLLLGLLAYCGLKPAEKEAGITTPPAATEAPQVATPEASPPATESPQAGSPEASPSPTANPFDEAVRQSKQKAAEALKALKPGAYGGKEVTGALNVLIINFSTGSAAIPPEDGEVLKQAAGAIKSLPPDTVIEVGGYTDNTGDAAANQKLSQQRAEAVVKELEKSGVSAKMLKAKGYGGEKPVAPNDTEEGRFKNRRIEFTVLGKQ